MKKGPVFANFILADEINRAPAKVQSALLEAMQERQVTIGEQTYPLPEPFLVMATQNPIEQEGTYPLPEAQLDRFMLKVVIGYPSKEEEKSILRQNITSTYATVNACLKAEDIIHAREVVREVYVDEKIENYITDIVFASRYPGQFGLQKLENMIKKVKMNPNFTAVVNRIAEQRTANWLRVQNEIRNKQLEAASSTSKTLDKVRDMWSEYIRDVDTVSNPNTGEKMFIDNRYDHAWINSDNEVIYHNTGFNTPNASTSSFDPNSNALFNHTSWQKLK